MKNRITRLSAALAAAAAFALAAPTGALAARELVPVGRTVGIEATTEGLLVAGLSQVETAAGSVCPASDSGIQPGDLIVRLGAAEVSTAEDFSAAAAALDGAPVAVTLRRGGRLIQYSVTPAMSTQGVWRLGLWLRDGVSGIGTVTYYDPQTGAFGALGHSISDVDTGLLLPLGGGQITGAAVTGVRRGESGKAGELQGAFDLEDRLGEIRLNTVCGIFGVMDAAPAGRALPVAAPGEIETGPATILANVAGREVREYAVEIAPTGKPADGRLSVRVTDPALLELTGGIVQGMSGCPILQDGRFVGAVTHVLLADAARGYGITLDAMLAAAEGEASETAA